MAQPPRCLLDGDPYKSPFGDCAIYSQSTVSSQFSLVQSGELVTYWRPTFQRSVDEWAGSIKSVLPLRISQAEQLVEQTQQLATCYSPNNEKRTY